jgi:predicted phosphoribosyltransferase
MMFRDRADAGRLLAEKLVPLVSGPAVVAGIPRGGLAVALPIVERLRVPLTTVYARKLTSPRAPEFAFGALDEDGETFLDPSTVAALDLTHDDIKAAKANGRAEIQRRMALYRVPPLAHYLPEATVILVDDGLATGLTMRAALRYARRHGAREIIVAAPCAAARTAERFRQEADRFLSLIVDEDFYAVGQYYIDFPQVSDAEVIAILERARVLVAEADRQHPV